MQHVFGDRCSVRDEVYLGLSCCANDGNQKFGLFGDDYEARPIRRVPQDPLNRALWKISLSTTADKKE